MFRFKVKQEVLKTIYKMHQEIMEFQDRRIKLNTGKFSKKTLLQVSARIAQTRVHHIDGEERAGCFA